MTKAKTTMAPSITLGLPLDRPMPVAGCARCARLTERRGEATGKGDFSQVSDIDVLIRRHHPGTPSRGTDAA